jgi:hypothetical protein
MLRCLAKPKKHMSSDYKHTMMNLHCAKRADEILENEGEQMSKFCQEAGLSLEQLHVQSKIQMAYAPKAWEVGEPMVDEKRFDNSTQTRHFHQWYLQHTCNKLREIDSCLDFNTNTTISTMVMASSGLCGMKCILY